MVYLNFEKKKIQKGRENQRQLKSFGLVHLGTSCQHIFENSMPQPVLFVVIDASTLHVTLFMLVLAWFA